MLTGSDITICRFTFSDQTNVDTFVCEDRVSRGNLEPIMDTIKNTVDISTNTLQVDNNVSGKTFMTFEATFQRPFISLDDDEDTNLPPDSNVNIIWAYGETSSTSSPNFHISQGTTAIYLSSNAYLMKALNSLAVVMMTVAFSTFLM